MHGGAPGSGAPLGNTNALRHGHYAAAAIALTVQSPASLAVIMFPLSVAAVATHRRNYRLFTFFLTPVFVLLAERFQGDWWVAAARASTASEWRSTTPLRIATA